MTDYISSPEHSHQCAAHSEGQPCCLEKPEVLAKFIAERISEARVARDATPLPRGYMARPTACFQLTIDVRACARCGSEHNALLFTAFENSPGNVSHWATCPESGEPILLKIVSDSTGPNRGVVQAECSEEEPQR